MHPYLHTAMRMAFFLWWRALLLALALYPSPFDTTPIYWISVGLLVIGVSMWLYREIPLVLARK